MLYMNGCFQSIMFICFEIGVILRTCMQIFDLFDVKQKGVIDFSDFVRSLNVFRPKAPQEDTIDCKL